MRLLRHEFIEKFIKYDGINSFSFNGREYLIPIYDSNFPFVIFKSGRQCEKSTFLAIDLILNGIQDSGAHELYVAPRYSQTKYFVLQKIKPILMSGGLRPFLSAKPRISEKTIQAFKSNSVIHIGSTHNGADRLRGLSIKYLTFDEIQEIDIDDVYIVMETTSHFSNKRILMAGTPTIHESSIEHFWKESKQLEYIVKCSKCNHEQIPSAENIAEIGLICRKCKSLLELPLRGRWVITNPKGHYYGFRITQLMRLGVSIKWIDDDGVSGIWQKWQRMPVNVFYNEVLGLPYEHGVQPITIEEFKSLAMDYNFFKNFDISMLRKPVVMGIDWGWSNSNTAIAIVAGYRTKPSLVYFEKLTGAQNRPDVVVKKIKELVHKFGVDRIFADLGFSFNYQPKLIEEFGASFFSDRMIFVRYARLGNRLVYRSRDLPYYLVLSVDRTNFISYHLARLKQGELGLPVFGVLADSGLVQDFLNVKYDTRQREKGSIEEIVYSRSGPDDGMHALFYAWFGWEYESGYYKMLQMQDTRQADIGIFSY